MKTNNLYVFAIATLLLFPLVSFSQSGYHVRHQAITNPNSTPPTYGNAVEFQTNQITSDFGRRRGSFSKWHRGVDYSVRQSEGDHILSLVQGEIKKLSGTGYKYILIEGDQAGSEYHFGYGHLFEDDPLANRTMEIGDMVLIELPDPHEGQYAIINLNSPGNTAIGATIVNNVTFIYNGTEYTVTNEVNSDDPIGIIGNSGGNYDYQHVHLYMFRDIDIAVDDHNNIHNDQDPLEYVAHEDTDYDVSIFGKTLEINSQHYINQNDVVVFPGDEEISLMVRWEMNGGSIGSTYTNVVMDIDDVHLYIKNSYTIPEESSNWGNESSNYQLIHGPWVKSKLSHGARTESDIYPTNIPPANPAHNTNPDINIANNSNAEHGSTTRTGIYPHAYYSTNAGYPYDDYYFSDFKTRVHNDDGFCMNDCDYASCNEQAKYKDGKYQLFAKVTTVRGDEYTSLTCQPEGIDIIIDNFRPFIDQLKIDQMWSIGGSREDVTLYISDWIFDGGSPGHYNFNALQAHAGKPDTDISFEITASEPLVSCTLSYVLSGHTSGTTIDQLEVNNEQTIWKFVLHEDEIPQAGDYSLHIEGEDMAGNLLQSDPHAIPIRQSATYWEPEESPGTDEFHSFSISTYAVAFTLNPVLFLLVKQHLLQLQTYLQVTVNLIIHGDGLLVLILFRQLVMELTHLQ